MTEITNIIFVVVVRRRFAYGRTTTTKTSSFRKA